MIVRPLAGFGAPTAIRISVGTPDELDLFAAALGRVLARRVSSSVGARLSLSRRLPVLRDDNFRLLFFATFGSGIGNWLAMIALTVDVYAAHRLGLVGDVPCLSSPSCRRSSSGSSPARSSTGSRARG